MGVLCGVSYTLLDLALPPHAAAACVGVSWVDARFLDFCSMPHSEKLHEKINLWGTELSWTGLGMMADIPS